MLTLKAKKRPLAVCCIPAAIVGATAAIPAHAQSNVLEEVVVTAQKREQNLQDVGISVTAFSGNQLDALGFKNSMDLVVHTPGLDANGYGGGAISTFNIQPDLR